MSLRRHLVALAALFSVLLLAGGCKKSPISPDYSRPLPPGMNALRKITDYREFPDPSSAFRGKDADLMTALDRSVQWFTNPSTKRFFPLCDISHDQAYASAIALREILARSSSPEEFKKRLYQECDPYISVGWNGQGVVLFTGYYSPIFNASKTPTAEYRYPLYKRPANLVVDPNGNTQGYSVNGAVQTYPARAEIESSGMLKGTELVYLKDKFEAYIIQVNGSARLTMADGTTMYIGYAGNNGHEYTSVGKLLVEAGKIDRNRVSLPVLREYFRAHPADLDSYTAKNERFVFFGEYTPDTWPAGALGVKVTNWRTLATDKAIFPRGGLILAQTTVPTGAPVAPVAGMGTTMGGSNKGEEAKIPAGQRPYDQFMLDQDAGGAIRAPGRADIYMGIGQEAENTAGHQYAEGKLYYFFLKPERVQPWLEALKAAKGGGGKM